jgi:hypothetical protein
MGEPILQLPKSPGPERRIDGNVGPSPYPSSNFTPRTPQRAGRFG